MTTPGLTGVQAVSERTRAEFKAAVLQGQIRRSQARGKRHVAAIPEAELETVEGRHRLRSAAARACRELLTDARDALTEAQAANEAGARGVRSVGIASSYRDYAADERAWNTTFSKHYARTEAQRERMPGGPHGDAACVWFVAYLAPIKAPPGFSNHSNGAAVDFSTEDGGVLYGANTDQRRGWRGTWLHQCLAARSHLMK